MYTKEEVEKIGFACYAEGLRFQHAVESKEEWLVSKWRNFDEWLTELIDTVKDGKS